MVEAEQVREPTNDLRSRALAVFYGVGGVVLALFAGYVLVLLWPMAILLMISLMLVAALTPIVRYIQIKFNRKTATTVVVTSLLIGILSAVVLTIPPLVSQMNTIAADFDNLFKQLQTQLQSKSPEMAKILAQIKVSAMPNSAAAPQAVKELLFSAFTIVTSFVTVLMLTVYLVVEGPAVATAMVSVFPRKARLQVRQMVGEIGDQVGSYIRGQLTTSILAGLTTYLVLTALQVPNALALAWLMALLDAVPIIGPVLGLVPPVVSAFGVSNQKALYVLIALVLYHQIESYLIVPRVYGKALKLSPLAVLLSILVGTSLLGAIGAFIALPFAAALPIFLRYFNEWRNQDDSGPDLPGEVIAAI